ncbi:hypothetical protein BC628DRAFT_1388329 [Trametes gibbosa]|nr:hypothetical protein BC628DRAFT_1388329 [Trametes gibbosa]
MAYALLLSKVADVRVGTLWYHAHLSTQYCDGLRGPLVVYDPKDPHASLYDAGSTEYNYDNPIWRDVVSTGTADANDNVTIRFRVGATP